MHGGLNPSQVATRESQDRRPDPSWLNALLILQHRQELLIVGRVVEDSLSIIAARDYVIEATFQLKAWESRHSARILFPPSQVANSKRIAESQA